MTVTLTVTIVTTATVTLTVTYQDEATSKAEETASDDGCPPQDGNKATYTYTVDEHVCR